MGNARYGGATLVMLDWSRFLAERGWQVDIVCTDDRMVEGAKQIPGATVIEDIFIPKEIEPIADLRAVAQLWALCRRRRYDVVHTYTATPSFLGRLAATLARVPVVVNHQGGWAVNETSSRGERLAYRPLEYVANLLCTRNICVSHAERTKALDLGLAPAHKLVTIVNGVDATPFRQSHDTAAIRSEWGAGPDTHLVGATSRLVPGKDNASFVEAASLVATRRPDLDVRFVLAGDGDADEREQLTNQIERLGLADRVRLAGFVGDIPAFLDALDIWVTTTLTEGLSISLLEALAAGKAVVATGIPPNAEVVVEGTGVTVPVKAPQQVADAILRYIDDPDRTESIRRAAMRHIDECYSMERMFDETLDLYERLLAGDTPSDDTRRTP